MLRTPDVASRSLGRRGWRSLVTGTALIVATVMPGFLTASLAPLLLIAGVANALGGPSVSALLKREVADHSQGLAFGAQQAGAPMGALLAGLALPALAIPFGWQWAFVAAAGLALFAVAFAPGAAATGARSAPAGRHPRGFSSVHALGVAAVLASAAGVGFVSFLVTYAVDSGMSEVAAGLLLAGVSLAATTSRIAMGVFADRAGQEPLRPVAALLAGSLGWAWPGGLTLAVVQRSPEATGWAVGVMMTGLFVGAVTGPLLTGFLAEHELFEAAWIACAALALMAAATIVATLRHEA